MLDNHLYNIYKQIVIENKSLWRIKSSYLEDAKGCAECKKFWKELETDKERWANKLEAHLKKHTK